MPLFCAIKLDCPTFEPVKSDNVSCGCGTLLCGATTGFGAHGLAAWASSNCGCCVIGGVGCFNADFNGVAGGVAVTIGV